MSEENVEIVRRALDAWNRRDLEAALAAARLSRELPGSSARIEARGVARWTIEDGLLRRVEILGAGTGYDEAARAVGM